MTPGARIAAAIEILDAIADGMPTEQALTRWARGSRFAGSKDRAAVRDHVFDVVRHWRSDATRGGAATGRGRMIGRLRAQGADLDTLFDGQGHAPGPLSDTERSAGQDPVDTTAAWDLPDWLVPEFEESLGSSAKATAHALTQRAPVTLRVNISRTTIAAVQPVLEQDGIKTQRNPRAETALTVVDGARRIKNASAYKDGLVEIQDAASQAAVTAIGAGGRALDLCAGGGGKALALAAQGWSVTASDADAGRMRDLPVRAARGGHAIAVSSAEKVPGLAPFDLVFVDAPCSGSGTWRRTPDAKWALTPERLAELVGIQRAVLSQAADLVRSGGRVVYATCSVLQDENDRQVAWFLDAHPAFQLDDKTQWPVDSAGDGFFSAHLTRKG